MNIVRFLLQECLQQVHERNIVSFESNIQLAYDRRVRQKKDHSFLRADFCIMHPCTSEKMSQRFKSCSQTLRQSMNRKSCRRRVVSLSRGIKNRTV